MGRYGRFRLRSNRIWLLGTIDEALELCCELNPDTVILDIEPALVGWTENTSELPERTALASQRLPKGTRVVLCTNSRRFLGATPDAVKCVSAARKPWTSRARLGAPTGRTVVVGDLLVLDGLLAMRLGWDFMWIKESRPAPTWPRILRGLDNVVAPFLVGREGEGA